MLSTPNSHKPSSSAFFGIHVSIFSYPCNRPISSSTLNLFGPILLAGSCSPLALGNGFCTHLYTTCLVSLVVCLVGWPTKLRYSLYSWPGRNYVWISVACATTVVAGAMLAAHRFRFLMVHQVQQRRTQRPVRSLIFSSRMDFKSDQSW